MPFSIAEEDLASVSPVLGILIGVVAVLVVVAIIIVIIVRVQTSKPHAKGIMYFIYSVIYLLNCS